MSWLLSWLACRYLHDQPNGAVVGLVPIRVASLMPVQQAFSWLGVHQTATQLTLLPRLPFHCSHGFCLFNNAAIGAAYAMNVYRHAGIRRVAIVDFDVHHGNGTGGQPRRGPLLHGRMGRRHSWVAQAPPRLACSGATFKLPAPHLPVPTRAPSLLPAEACVTNTVPSASTYKFRTPYRQAGPPAGLAGTATACPRSEGKHRRAGACRPCLLVLAPPHLSQGITCLGCPTIPAAAARAPRPLRCGSPGSTQPTRRASSLPGGAGWHRPPLALRGTFKGHASPPPWLVFPGGSGVVAASEPAGRGPVQCSSSAAHVCLGFPRIARRLPCSVQGYGPKAEDYPAYVYPGSGATCDTKELAALRAAEEAAAAEAKAGQAVPGQQAGGQPGEAMEVDGSSGAARQQGAAPASPPGQQNGGEATAVNGGAQSGAAPAAAAGAQQSNGADEIEEDPDREFVYRGKCCRLLCRSSSVLVLSLSTNIALLPVLSEAVYMALSPSSAALPLPLHAPLSPCLWLPSDCSLSLASACPRAAPHTQPSLPAWVHRTAGGQVPPVEGPRVIDVGIPGFGPKVALWRRSWRDKIFPALVKFQPDMIFICAGGHATCLDGCCLGLLLGLVACACCLLPERDCGAPGEPVLASGLTLRLPTLARRSPAQSCFVGACLAKQRDARHWCTGVWIKHAV